MVNVSSCQSAQNAKINPETTEDTTIVVVDLEKCQS